MSGINLLPDRFIEARRRRSQVRCWGAAALALLVLGSVWGTFAYRQLSRLTLEVTAAQIALDLEQQQLDELEAIYRECDQLRALLAVPAGVTLPVPTSALLSLLGQLLPESTVLTRLMVDMPPPLMLTETTHRGQTGPRPSSQAARLIRIELEGIALSSTDVARLVRTFGRHRLFSDVSLTRSRNVTVAGAARVAFQISMNVSVRAVAPAEEYSHAD